MVRFRRLQLFSCWLLLQTIALFCSSIELGHGPRSHVGPAQNESEAVGNVTYTNASDLLSSLLKEYDIRLRPGFGGEALVLTMDMIIASFDAMSEVNMDYTVTMYLHQYWRDERLSWSSARNVQDMTLSGDFSANIWVPDTFLANDKHSFLHDVTETNKMLRLRSDGHVAYGMRFTSTLACHMDLRNYPLDAQNCTIEIESYGYTTSEVLMKWNHPHPVKGVAEADVPQFTIIGFHTEDSIVKTATGHYQRLSLVFQLRRSIGYFIFQTYLPCILIVMLSWVSFWINHEATSARVALGITTVLTMTTISTGVRQSLPRISYVKSIDIYLVMCFVFVFAALLEYAAVNYSYWGDRARKKAREKKAAQHTNPAQLEMLPATADDSEGAVNLYREWGVPNTFMEEQRDADPEAIFDPMAEHPSLPPHVRPKTVTTAASTAAAEKRPPSPLPSLFHSTSTNHVSSAHSASTGIIFEGSDDANANEFPDYPRVQSAYGRPLPQLSNARLRQRGTNASRAKRGIMPTARRAAGLKQSLYTIRRKARSVIPRIRDINVIDQYSRVVFPASFILFNAFYWTYYTMMQ